MITENIVQDSSISRKEGILKNQSLLKDVGLSIGCIETGLFCGRGISTNIWTVGNKILDSTKFCFSSIFPSGTSEFFDKYINYPKWLNVTNANFACRMVVVYGPVFEELVDRVILQEFLLKRVPEKILQKVSPQYSHLINHSAVKITRIFLSSVFFALHHSWALTCISGDMYPYLLAGVTLGILQEVSGHPFYNIIAHLMANASNYNCMNLKDYTSNYLI